MTVAIDSSFEKFVDGYVSIVVWNQQIAFEWNLQLGDNTFVVE